MFTYIVSTLQKHRLHRRFRFVFARTYDCSTLNIWQFRRPWSTRNWVTRHIIVLPDRSVVRFTNNFRTAYSCSTLRSIVFISCVAYFIRDIVTANRKLWIHRSTLIEVSCRGTHVAPIISVDNQNAFEVWTYNVSSVCRVDSNDASNLLDFYSNAYLAIQILRYPSADLRATHCRTFNLDEKLATVSSLLTIEQILNVILQNTEINEK